MTHFSAFSLEITRVVRIGLCLDGKLLDNVHAVPFEADHLFGIVGQETDVANAEVDQNLGAGAIFTEIRRKA